MAKSLPDPSTGWYFEGYLDETDHKVRVQLNVLPFRIGRANDQNLSLHSSEVSSNHAVVFHNGRNLVLHDMESTNGTYVNHKRLRGDVALNPGDVVHFATAEFLLSWEPEPDGLEATVTRSMDEMQLSRHYFQDIAAFRRMLAERRLKVLFQPIVALTPSGWQRDAVSVVAWEALGRAEEPGLPSSAHDLFEVAESISQEALLSSLLREKAAEEAGKLPDNPVTLFVNTHPAETDGTELLESIADIRRRNVSLHLVLEIHEQAITDLRYMREFARALDDLGVQLAYDDFGAGQARLIELVEAPPHYLKFDRAMVAGLGAASSQKQQLIETLVRMVLDFGITPLAEGIEDISEAKICADFGFQLGQGYFYGLPASAGDWRTDEP